MTKNGLTKLECKAWSIISLVQNTIKELTANNPLVLFDPDKLDTDEGITQDEMYELPYAYYVGKYEYYNEGRIQKVQGDSVVLFLTCEGMYGDTWDLELNQVPFECLVSLLDYLKERM